MEKMLRQILVEMPNCKATKNAIFEKMEEKYFPDVKIDNWKKSAS